MSNEAEEGASLLLSEGDAPAVGVGARIDEGTSRREVEEWAVIFDALAEAGLVGEDGRRRATDWIIPAADELVREYESRVGERLPSWKREVLVHLVRIALGVAVEK